MPRRSGPFLLRTVFFCAFASLPLLAQTPGSGDASAAPSILTATESAPQKSTHLLADSNIKLSVGDLIEISVFGVPDLATKARVSSAGDVYLPLIDYVHVGDLTTDEAQELIQKRLEDGGFVRNPHVTIFVNESASQAITVVGEVARPGTYPAIGERRLYDLLSMAGGLTDRAGRGVIITHRGDSDQKVELQLPQNLAEDTRNNIGVLPGDTIIVSRAGIVYVVGDVQHPSGFVIQDSSLTVLKALALAGGSTRTSSLNKTKILRQTANGVQEIPVPLKKVLHAKAPDVALVKGDVLFVPGSSAKAAAYRTAEAAMSLSTALSVVAVHP
ncbi:MAG: polysaccharide export protein [Acidobacteriia bacterium]|nr:polysaccharide export protein [Terriglobia bacterium]